MSPELAGYLSRKKSLSQRPNANAIRGCERTRFMECSHLTIESLNFGSRAMSEPARQSRSRCNRSMKERRPIFYDEQRVRWRFTRRALEVSGVLLTLLLVYFFVTIAVSVDLPAGLIPDPKSPYHALKNKKNGKVTPLREGRHRRVANV